MPRARRDVETILKVARMRYDQRLTPSEIAEALKISESTVSRVLKTAKDMGFVGIQVLPTGWRDIDLEQRLGDRYGLDLAVVVHKTDWGGPFGALPRALSTEVEERLAPGTVIGVSDGETVAAIAAAIRRGRSQDIDVVSLIGGLGAAQVPTYSTEIGRVLAANLGGRAWQLPAPAVVESAGAAEALFGMGLVRSVFEKMGLVSIALVGIGAMTPQAAVFSHGMIDPGEIDAIIARGAIGSICARFFDRNGTPIASEFNDRTIAITLPDLARVGLRIGAAIGLDKVAAIRAALGGGLVNALATDVETATALLG
jgi:DNA-binding transcriptional regulator LsrR (DeoR family)